MHHKNQHTYVGSISYAFIMFISNYFLTVYQRVGSRRSEAFHTKVSNDP